MDLWIIFVGPSLKLAYAVLAIFVAWLLLQLLDRVNGQRYSSAAEIMARDPLAVSHYRGARLVALALLLGLLFSR